MWSYRTPWPTRADLDQFGLPAGFTLLALPRIPLTERTHGYNLVPPDTITLFQGPIAAGWDPETIRRIHAAPSSANCPASSATTAA